MNTRRLTFAVGTSLLTASLATGVVGCKKTSTPGPDGPHVNEGPDLDDVANPGPVDDDDDDDDDEDDDDDDDE